MDRHDAEKLTGRIDEDAAFDIVAAVYRQAIRDARDGCPHAQEWLSVVAPDRLDDILASEGTWTAHRPPAAGRGNTWPQ